MQRVVVWPVTDDVHHLELFRAMVQPLLGD
jgi:hypothetical protein